MRELISLVALTHILTRYQSFLTWSKVIDPISIIATSANMVASCGKITRSIYTFLRQVKNVDVAIQALAIVSRRFVKGAQL